MPSFYSIIIKSNDGSTTLMNGTNLIATKAYIGKKSISLAGPMVLPLVLTLDEEISGLSLSANATTATYTVGSNIALSTTAETYYIVPAKKEPIIYNNMSTDKKIQVESAIRDGVGNRIDTTYIKKDDLFDIGGIYISVNEKSPASIFGGTWERINGRFLLSASDSYTISDTGGSSTYTLTEANMPSHTHSMSFTYSGVSGSWNNSSDLLTVSRNAGITTKTTGSKGSGSSFSIMPPYCVVYMWVRIG